METTEKSYVVWVLEAFISAVVIGIIKGSWGWFFISLIGTMILLAIPIIGGAVGIFLSLFIASGIGSLFSNEIAEWYIGVILFIILAFLNSKISESGYKFFGVSIIIFEAFAISGAIYMSTKQLNYLPIIVFGVLVVLAFVPLLRLFEYIILSILSLIEVYNTVAENIVSPHTYVITFLIGALMIYYFRMVYYAFNYRNVFRRHNEQSEDEQRAYYENDFDESSETHEEYEPKNETNNSKVSLWFAGVKSAEELKKRYKELLKIYHPDNQTGDTAVAQQIQEEYERLSKQM